MKRISLMILLAAITLSGMAQTIGEAFYIYRNDGQFNAFFRDEVQAIEYSYYDADSVKYEEIVTQVVITADSVYKIPLAAIDSVGFVTLETVYQPNVKRIDGELWSYVLSADKLTVYFKSNTPTAILPRVGDKLVTTEMSDVFPIGFAGEVVEVSHSAERIAVVCTTVALEEIFKYYYGVSGSGQNTSSFLQWETPASSHRASGIYAPGRIRISLLNDMGFTNSYVPNDKLSFDLSELKADIYVTPVVYGNVVVMVNPFYGVNVSLTVTGEYDLEETFSLCGGITLKKDIDVIRVPWAIAPLVDVYLAVGGFLQAGGEFAIDQTWTQKYRSAFHWEYSSKGQEVVNPENKVIPVSSNHSGEAALKGYIGAGIYLEAGFDFVHTKKLDIANVNLRAEAGVNLEGSLVIHKSDMESAKTSTAVYEQLRDSEIDLNWFYGITANASILKWGVSHDVNLGKLPLNNQGKIFSCAMAPTFSDVEADWSNSNSTTIEAKAKISCPAWLGGRCIISDAGFVLKDAEGDDVSRSYLLNGYNGSQGIRDLSKQFANVPLKSGYKLYPFIKWMGNELLASPYAEVSKNIIVHTLPASNVEKNSATIAGKVEGYIAGLDDGEVGFYYNTTGNPSQGNGKSVYVGRLSYFSDGEFLASLSDLEENTTYYYCAYYYSDGEYQYGETCSFTTKKGDEPGGDEQAYLSCPDGNHPHWIDLGIGTLWSCCNVGASKPEDYGGYYTFDEAQAYSPPSRDQIKAMVNNCSYIWTTHNGVMGAKFTGPNGCTIFLPAAGGVWNGKLIDVGKDCFYWSSTPFNEKYAYDLDLHSFSVNWHFMRGSGHSVRPVR